MNMTTGLLLGLKINISLYQVLQMHVSQDIMGFDVAFSITCILLYG